MVLDRSKKSNLTQTKYKRSHFGTHPKKNLRQELLAQRKAYAKGGQKEQCAKKESRMAQKLLMASHIWQNAASVALYMAVRGEMDTRLLIESAWQQGKTLFLPRCRPIQEKGHMDFIVCHSMNDLCVGSFGIMEPAPHICPVENADSTKKTSPPQILLLPGVGFDRRGYRLGFGGGYYDRALTQEWLTHTVRIALCYTWQIVDHIPTEPWDVPVHAIVTEEGIVWI